MLTEQLVSTGHVTLFDVVLKYEIDVKWTGAWGNASHMLLILTGQVHGAI